MTIVFSLSALDFFIVLRCVSSLGRDLMTHLQIFET